MSSASCRPVFGCLPPVLIRPPPAMSATLPDTARRGLVLGKFLPYHTGHARLIRTARSQVDVVAVLVCSIARERHSHDPLRLGGESRPDCCVVPCAEEVPQTPTSSRNSGQSGRTSLLRRHAGDVNVVFTSKTMATSSLGDSAFGTSCGPCQEHLSGFRHGHPTIRSGTGTYIPPVVRPSYVHRVAILGTESTGKTTLAQQLADAFGTTWGARVRARVL